MIVEAFAALLAVLWWPLAAFCALFVLACAIAGLALIGLALFFAGCALLDLWENFR